MTKFIRHNTNPYRLLLGLLVGTLFLFLSCSSDDAGELDATEENIQMCHQVSDSLGSLRDYQQADVEEIALDLNRISGATTEVDHIAELLRDVVAKEDLVSVLRLQAAVSQLGLECASIVGQTDLPTLGGFILR